MLTAILIIAVFVCAAGWFANWIIAAAMIEYFRENGCPDPTEQEISKCLRKVWMRIFKINS